MAHPQSTFRDTSFHGKSILSVRRDTIAKTTVHTQLNQLRSTGRYDCFKLKWHPVYDRVDRHMWPVPPHLFWDSDIGKWIEAACYFLEDKYDEEIDKAVQELVGMIRCAQGDDGYLNLHYTVVEPEKRWSNLRDMHELYNAGHLIEAALAHKNYYKNDLLLEPILKYVSLIRKTFGPGEHQLHGYPGHPEIELALFRLYAATGSQDAYDLSRYFLEERGNPSGQEGRHYFEWEAEKRGDSPHKRPEWYPNVGSLWYSQAHQPILDQPSVEGHSVRCMYLLTAVADMIHLDRQSQSVKIGELPALNWEAWTTAVTRLWENMVDKKMYLTGGIGAMKQYEGFGMDYFLPQGTDEGGCYAETCASIAVMMLAERLLQIDVSNPNRRYSDVMEISLYNNIMTAMSLDGNAFTYVNQLASSNQDPSARSSWFEVSCCPPNLARLFGSLGGYLWDYGCSPSSPNESFINVHLYTTAKLTFDNSHGNTITLEQSSNYPWSDTISFTLTTPISTTIRLRLPAWSHNTYTLSPSLNPSHSGITITPGGYLLLPPSYTSANPSFTLTLPTLSVPRYIAPHPHTNQHTLSLARGPIVYCAEDIDNPWEQDHFKDVGIRAGTKVEEERRVDEGTGEEYVALRTRCWRRRGLGGGGVEREGQPGQEVVGDEGGLWEEERELVLVPYYFRANRAGRGQMRVGLVRI